MLASGAKRFLRVLRRHSGYRGGYLLLQVYRGHNVLQVVIPVVYHYSLLKTSTKGTRTCKGRDVELEILRHGSIGFAV